MDVFYYAKKSLYDTGKIEQAIEALRGKGLIYQGTLPPPKGKQLRRIGKPANKRFLNPRITAMMSIRPIQTFDGSWTYFAPDIAYQL